jgi:hypothetical protein
MFENHKIAARVSRKDLFSAGIVSIVRQFGSAEVKARAFQVW